MSTFLREVRSRLVIFTVLVLLSIFFALPQRSASACFECVGLSGGLCVGCDPNVSQGHTSCEPDQSTCTCNVGPSGCGSGHGPGGLE